MVSVALPSLKQYSGFVPLSDTYPGFLRRVDETLKSKDTNKDQRLQLAKQNTWEHRLEELSKLITSALT